MHGSAALRRCESVYPPVWLSESVGAEADTEGGGDSLLFEAVQVKLLPSDSARVLRTRSNSLVQTQGRGSSAEDTETIQNIA